MVRWNDDALAELEDGHARLRADELEATWLDVLEGKAPPSAGYIVRF